MAHITLRVLDGADRGLIYDELATPITIGREEGNAVQLNDERISRFHIKIQEDQDKIVLTDLESTNGTRVNGEETQLRILRYGDLISVGRSVLLYGTREQIAARLTEVQANGVPSVDSAELDDLTDQADSGTSSKFDFELKWVESEELRGLLHLPAPPELPEGLGPGQAAQFSEILEYLHLRSRALIQSVSLPEGEESVEIDLERWQELLAIQSLLAEYLRKIGDPGGA